MPIRLDVRRQTLHLLRKQVDLPFGAQRFLALLEGIEGGFAIGASVVVGLSFAHLDHRLLVISAVISILVNGFNSAAVKYSSEHYGDELDGHEKRSAFKNYFIPSAIEFLAYFIISFITLIPLLLLSDTRLSLILTSLATLIMLFAAGYWRGYLLGFHPAKDGFEMVLLGVAIILVGGGTGYVMHLF